MIVCVPVSPIFKLIHPMAGLRKRFAFSEGAIAMPAIRKTIWTSRAWRKLTVFLVSKILMERTLHIDRTEPCADFL